MATVMGVFTDEEQAKRSINLMKEMGINEDKISFVARRNEENDMEAGEGMMNREGQNLADGATTGGALGGVAGLIAGAGMLAIPGIGPVLAAGPLAAGLTGAAAGGVTGSIVDYGLDEETGKRYASELENGKILVAAEDMDENKINDIAQALRQEGAYDVVTK